GRVVELQVTGSKGTFFIRGFRIRTALGIRENLFTVDRTHDAAGQVDTFIFSGKGWGHGLGLCQVGAYGMALRGKSYEEILHHYYPGGENAQGPEPWTGRWWPGDGGGTIIPADGSSAELLNVTQRDGVGPFRGRLKPLSCADILEFLRVLNRPGL